MTKSTKCEKFQKSLIFHKPRLLTDTPSGNWYFVILYLGVFCLLKIPDQRRRDPKRKHR